LDNFRKKPDSFLLELLRRIRALRPITGEDQERLSEVEYMNEFDWYGLDNAAKIFPAISGRNTSHVFRIDVRLKELVDPALLAKAVNQTLPSFPAFMVRMRQGLFWYYFEHNYETAIVEEENEYPTGRIIPELNNGYLFRFSYFNNKINLDVFHSLSDGTGALSFLTAVTGCYLRLCGKPVEDSPPAEDHTNKHAAMQDSFSRFISPRQAKKITRIKAYHVKGTARPRGSVKVIHGIFETDKFKELTKSKHVTVTVYLASVLAHSIRKTIPDGSFDKPIRLSIPINLRNFYESETQRNFFTPISIDWEPGMNAEDFDSLLMLMSDQLTARTKPEYFLPIAGYYLQAEQNILTRVMPLMIKNLALRLMFRRIGEKTRTCTFSSLGKIEVPPSIAEYIERYEAMTGNTKTNHFNMIVCTYRNQMVVTFTKSDYETDIEKHFFRFLSDQGLKITLEENQADPI
jgi:NRPS condensation-like uncharacterized protein